MSLRKRIDTTLLETEREGGELRTPRTEEKNNLGESGVAQAPQFGGCGVWLTALLSFAIILVAISVTIMTSPRFLLAVPATGSQGGGAGANPASAPNVGPGVGSSTAGAGAALPVPPPLPISCGAPTFMMLPMIGPALVFPMTPAPFDFLPPDPQTSSPNQAEQLYGSGLPPFYQNPAYAPPPDYETAANNFFEYFNQRPPQDYYSQEEGSGAQGQNENAENSAPPLDQKNDTTTSTQTHRSGIRDFFSMSGGKAKDSNFRRPAPDPPPPEPQNLMANGGGDKRKAQDLSRLAKNAGNGSGGPGKGGSHGIRSSMYGRFQPQNQPATAASNFLDPMRNSLEGYNSVGGRASRTFGQNNNWM